MPDVYFFNDIGGQIRLSGNEAWTAYEYVDRAWNETTETVETEKKTVYRYVPFDKVCVSESGEINISSENGEWYILRQDTLLNNTVQCFVNTNIVLCDGKTLTCSKGVINEDNNVLNIYGQENDTGTLNASGSSGTEDLGSTTSAGIGGKSNRTSGDINIIGGTITAVGGKGCSGIGSGEYGDMIHNITIYGGHITASGSAAFTTENGGAGIGSASKSDFCGIITIYGGEINADSKSNAAGIGCGAWSDLDGEINIKGGNINAQGNVYAAGIGTSYGGKISGKIRITGGSVKAVCGGNTDNATASAIGCGGKDGESAELTGEITIGNEMSVSTGSEINALEYAQSSERTAKMQERSNGHTQAIAWIRKCVHPENQWKTAPTSHQRACSYCLTDFQREEHTFSGDTCAVCHVEKTVQAETAEDLFDPLSEGRYVLVSHEYTLSSDIITEGRIYVPEGVTAVIDLNGHTIDRGLNAYTQGGHVFSVEKGGKLTVRNGTITGGAAANSHGGGFRVNGELILENVTVEGCKAQGSGGGIFVNEDNASVRLIGSCIIRSNTAGNDGGGICVRGNNTSVTLEDNCVVSHNTASAHGSGIYVHKDAGINMQGHIVIKDNTASNLYLDDTRKINITSTLTTGTSVGITYVNAGSAGFTNGYSIYNDTDAPDGLFFGDCGDIVVLRNGEARSAYEYISRSWNSAEKKVEIERKTIDTYIPLDKVGLSDDGNVYLGDENWYVVRQDTLFNDQVFCMVNPKLLLCDGKTFKCTSSIVVENNNTLSIYDQAKGSGALKCETWNCDGVYASAIGAKDTWTTSGEINIYGGTVIADNTLYSPGLGSFNKMEHDINIYGGNVSAYARSEGPAIGSKDDMAAHINIYGGNVTSRCDKRKKRTDYGGAGIGSGFDGKYTGEIHIYGGKVDAQGGNVAAGIGAAFKCDMEGRIIIEDGDISTGGCDGNAIGGSCSGYTYSSVIKGNIEILGGHVRCTSFLRSEPYTNVIGYNAGKGMLIIGSNMTVNINGKRSVNGERWQEAVDAYADSEAGIHYSCVEFTECDHSGCTYFLIKEDTSVHRVCCNYCGYSETEGHTNSSEGKCVFCGYYSGVPAYTITLVQKNQDGTVAGKDGGTVACGSTYVLPVCDSIPSGRIFRGWTVGEDTMLKQPGDEITVTDNTSLIAQYTEVSYISGANMTLRGNIDVNVYLKKSSLLDEKAYVTIQGPNDSKPEKIVLSDLPTVEEYGYKLSRLLSAKQMGEKMEIHLYSGDETEQTIYNTNRSTAYTNGYKYSPTDYFTEVKLMDGQSELKALTEAMANYGEYAREYFNSEAAPICSPTEITDVTAAVLSGNKGEKTGTAPENAAYYGSSLLLKSQTSLRLYFTGKLTDFDVKDSDGSNVTYKSGTSQNMYYIEIRDISAKDLDKKFTVTAGEYKVTASALTYAYNTLNTYGMNSEKTKLCNLVKALYKYNVAAKAFYNEEE